MVESPENGDVNFNTTTFGSVVTYSCAENFVLVGDEERLCKLEGWTGSNPTCG